LELLVNFVLSGLRNYCAGRSSTSTSKFTTMDTTSLTVGIVFASALALSLPLGRLFRIKLSDGRYTHIDGMRAIAALMVVSSHYAKHAINIDSRTDYPPLVGAMGDVGVQIFFCITAFLFTRKALAGPVDVPALIASRVRRIVPLYLVCMTVAVLLAAYISDLSGKEAVRYSDVLNAYAVGFVGGETPSIGGVSLVGIIGQVWSLRWEWLFYLCVPFLAAVLARRSWSVALAVLVGVCAAYQMPQPWVFFLPGVLCALVERHVKIGAPAQLLLLAAGLLAFYLALTLGAAPYGVQQLALCAVGFPALLFGHKWMLSIRPLRVLGEVSYSIYLVHLFGPTVFWMCVNFFAPQELRLVEDKYQLAAALVPVSLALAFLTYALIERLFMAKATRQSSGVAHARQPSAGVV